MLFNIFTDLDTSSGSVARNAGKISGLGSRCLIITGKNAAKKCGALDDILKVLRDAEIPYCIFDKILANPSVESCIAAAHFGLENKADFVIGIGGGSPLDAAKAAGIFLANPELDEDGFYKTEWKNEPAPVVLVGTTAGTGSEVTAVSVLTDKFGKKHSLHSNALFASLSLGDPAYTMSLTKEITLSTGIDALTHCIESYFSNKANDISRTFAVKGISLLMDALEAAFISDNLSIETRSALYDGSIFGGLAICITGTVFPHSLGYYLTEKYGVPHGTACAEYTKNLLLYVRSKCPSYADLFYSQIQMTENEFINLIEKVRPKSGICLTESEIDPIISRFDCGSVHNTISDISLEEIRSILLH